MYKVVLKGTEAVSVKCLSCKASLEIQANRHRHPVTLAFTHPKQCITAKCRNCAKDVSWSPEELMAAPIAPVAPEPVSFDAKDLMSAHFDVTNLEPATA